MKDRTKQKFYVSFSSLLTYNWIGMRKSYGRWIERCYCVMQSLTLTANVILFRLFSSPYSSESRKYAILLAFAAFGVAIHNIQYEIYCNYHYWKWTYNASLFHDDIDALKTAYAIVLPIARILTNQTNDE